MLKYLGFKLVRSLYMAANLCLWNLVGFSFVSGRFGELRRSAKKILGEDNTEAKVVQVSRVLGKGKKIELEGATLKNFILR